MTEFTQQVVKHIQEMQRLGIIKAGNQVEYAISHADELDNMKVADAADLICHLTGENA